MTDAGGTNRYGYDAVGQLLREDGPWSDDTVSYTCTNRLRTGLSLLQPSASAWTQSYAYDAMKRWTNTTSPAGAFGYQYVGPGAATLVSRLSLPNGAFITNRYDNVSRLLATVLKNSSGTILNSFAGNEPIGSADPFGYEKLGLTFDFNPKGSDPNVPSDTIFVQSAAEMVEIAKRKVGKYDPKGKDCNCINYVVIAAHGGGGGEVQMSDVTFNAKTHETNVKARAAKTPEAYAAWLGQRSDRRGSVAAYEILSQLAALKCEEIKVVILQCEAGEGPAGKLLGEQLAGLFGPRATIETYEGECGFSPLFHKPFPKWNLLNTSKKKTR